MKAIKTILALVIGIAIGVFGYHVLRVFQSRVKPTDGPRISHSTSDPERAAMETLFALQYARLHTAKDLEGLMALGKFAGVWENIITSKKDNLARSFANEISGFKFRELSASEIPDRDLTDLSLEPLLECTVSFAQTNPEAGLPEYPHLLGVEAGHLYIVDRVKK